MQIESRPLADIKPYPGNPRVNEGAVPAVAESIREFGFRVPILLDADGVIVAGHTRYAAAQRLGMAEVPVIVVADLPPERIRALRIADNQSATLSSWDEELLFRELDDLRAANFDLSVLGFSDLDLSRYAPPEAVEGHTDADAVPGVPAEPASRLGEVYELGRHRLACGDAGAAGTLSALMAGDRADMVLADATPYAAQGEAGVLAALKEADAVLKPGASFYLMHIDALARPVRSACRAVGWEIRQGLVWVKDAPTPLEDGEYERGHESVVYGWKAGASHNWFTDRRQTTLLDFKRSEGVDARPGEKPVELFAYFLKNSCPAGGVVLDPFGGTGASAVAAEKGGVRARLAEMDPTACDVARRRWAEYVHGEGCDWQRLTPVLTEIIGTKDVSIQQ